ncbi:PREDICTED: E3 ubiquitin-protein ligase SINA-like 7 [Camelina sativa]|uniref:RING-type E3 ubiquitin transferase n=1 Tax=Camelina sativa TaxID=90675 RepID=A0ABM0VEI6_CAMSA|nr:PREDICTED: E3 ubiquitin-protein ligase SINA-like 7 [Camelina sativa]
MVGASISASSGERAGYSSASDMVGASSPASSGQRARFNQELKSQQLVTAVLLTWLEPRVRRRQAKEVIPAVLLTWWEPRVRRLRAKEVIPAELCLSYKTNFFFVITLLVFLYFQCDNGHLACSSCCPKLSNKCPYCALPIGHIRNRAMESVLRSISIPCPNAKFGCTNNVSYGLESTHVKECSFSRCSCPALDCDYTGSYINVWRHYCYGSCPASSYESFTYNVSSTVRMNISDKINIQVDHMKMLLFAVQCFRESYGVCVTVSCIAPSSPHLGKFSYHLSYTVDGNNMTNESADMKRIIKVSFQTPLENFMLIPHSSLRGEMLEMKLTIKEVNQV